MAMAMAINNKNTYDNRKDVIDTTIIHIRINNHIGKDNYYNGDANMSLIQQEYT
jgi:hypothetical protein